MMRILPILFLGVLAVPGWAWAAEPLPADPSQPPDTLVWHRDYATAVRSAKTSGRMLLILLKKEGDPSPAVKTFHEKILPREDIHEKLARYELAELDLSSPISSKEGEEPTRLIDHRSFREMRGREGIAILDYCNPDCEHFGRVISLFPFHTDRGFTAEQVAAILDLPHGTLTQRTLIYAVRTHPEHPASTDGQFSPFLADEARKQSRYQADIQLQGHHNWESRFQHISAQLPGGLLAQEVCAESWPGEDLLEAAEDCVDSWRHSSGHWSAVRQKHTLYGYDLKRGANGVWYGTGIFAIRD